MTPPTPCPNLYVHFPFCRRKCAYCALPSRAGTDAATRSAYVAALVRDIRARAVPPASLRTVYFGGGSPALCDLAPLCDVLRPALAADAEFTVELHPLDVTRDLLMRLVAGGVNRVSMGVQSLDDAVLADMGRGYGADDAERAFARVRSVFDNAGIDLIVGYPNDTTVPMRLPRLAAWGLRHCSVYSLMLEDGTRLARRVREGLVLPDDDMALDALRQAADALRDLGLERYEISNYALPGFECRHNCAVWRGEDYVGLGEGASGRVGLLRTTNDLLGCPTRHVETVTPDWDARERQIFRLRTRDGLDTASRPEWRPTLDRFVAEGLLVRSDVTYRLTPRGTEVCDAILAEL